MRCVTSKLLRMNISTRVLKLFCLLCVLSSVFCVSALSAPAARIECKPLPSKVLGHPVHYCIVMPPSYETDKTRKYPVLYFFHDFFDLAETELSAEAAGDA